MPLPSEHSCRLKDPGKYDRLRRKNCDQKHEGKCIDVIYGVKDNKSEVQALRYPKDIWTAADAREHCKARGGNFEEASKEEDLAARRWYAIKQEKEDTAEISIFDEIGGWFGQTLADFKRRWDEIKDKKAIKVLINSPGGDPFDGMAIYNLLAARREKVSIEILGVAASIASVIAMAGKEVIMGEGSYLMIHNPTGCCVGEAKDMLKIAAVLEKIQGQIANVYAGRSNLTKEELLARMAEETWYTPAEALEAGLADAVLDHGPVKAAFDLTGFGYRRVPSRLAEFAASARAALQTSVKESGGNMEKTVTELLAELQQLSEEERAQLSEEDRKKIAELFGFAKLEQQIADLTGSVKALQEKASLQEEKLALLQAEKDTAAKEAADLRLEKARAEKTQAIEAALAAGKIAPVNRALWEALYDKDPEGTRKLLEAQQPVVDLGERGTATGGEESDLTPEELAMAAKAGISKADMDKYGPKEAGKEK
jgi:ATP-dependent protease ClpP protease subunit